MNPKLIIFEAGKEPREVEMHGEIVTFGRAADNSVAFAADSNVSRYHAQIVRRDNEFYVSDFNSSNGTTVNDERIGSEKPLKKHDKICFGGDSCVEFVGVEDSRAANANQPANISSGAPTVAQGANENAATTRKSGFPAALTAAAVLSGLAIVAVAAVGIGFLSDTGCAAEAAILAPESGVTISDKTDIKLAVKNAKCVERVAFLLDGEEIAATETAPYSIALEPENFKDLVDDDNSHVLTVAVVDRSGNRKLQQDEILIGFAKPEKDADKPVADEPDTDSPNNSDATPTRDASAQITIAEAKTLSENLVKQFSGNQIYKFDQQFLREVQKKTAEYKSAGFSRRANVYRDAINQAFVGEQGLDAPLGYVLAMSRSRFDNKKAGDKQGLWQMSEEFAKSNGYNGQCGAETLSDASQTCAARAAAIYAKALIVNLFQGDVIYGAACFGMSPAEAGQFSVGLPPDRQDFWNNIKAKPQRDQLVNFFAAGIVAENPQKFGLKQDQPLSNLYKNLIGQK